MTDEKKFHFDLTTKHIDVISAALGEMPGKIMLPVWQELMRQFTEQNAAPKPDDPEA